MRYLKTYEEFKFKDDESDVLEMPETKEKEPLLRDMPVDDSILGGKVDDAGSSINSKGIITIKNWKVY